MRHLIISLIVPLTIISFWSIGKWWYALPEDAPDTIYTGFPLIYSGPGWHTSFSYQIFITELIIDLLFYFAFWFLIVFLIKRFKQEFKVTKIITFGLWVATFVLAINQTFLLIVSDNVYHLKRPYPIQVLETGIEFGWKIPQRPDYDKYFPKDR
ncbi:MAG TPA: hypothetical protein VK169_05010 [Saprospiraceae bacterium]|nr:hypothetical protein [Saprospiraceae bacterium]